MQTSGLCVGGPARDDPNQIARTNIIGRESDNDICLRDRSVHRYHALIHRSPDAEYFITDLSGDGGNGVWVNGVKQRAVELCSGDLIQLGSADVRFVRGRASQ